MSKEKKKRRELKNISMKKKSIIILSFLLVLVGIGIAICFTHKPINVEVVSREKRNIAVTTNIQNIEIKNISTEKNLDRKQTETMYIMLKNIANNEQTIEDIIIELIDSNHVSKGTIHAYIPKMGANSNYEIKAITNIDLSDVSKINIVRNAKKD